jgi:rhodanese-related sulfurtransferase
VSPHRAILTSLLLAIAVALVACANPAPAPIGGTSALSADAQKALAPDADMLVPARFVMEAFRAGVDIVFVDARTPLDFEFGHIPGAVNVPYFEVEKHIAALDPTRLHITYCECPHAEAVQTADALVKAGFTNVKVIDEGLQGWRDEGGELVGATTAPGDGATAAPGDGATAGGATAVPVGGAATVAPSAAIPTSVP